MYRSEYFGEEMPHLEESKSLENGVSESQLGTEILHRNTDWQAQGQTETQTERTVGNWLGQHNSLFTFLNVYYVINVQYRLFDEIIILETIKKNTEKKTIFFFDLRPITEAE